MVDGRRRAREGRGNPVLLGIFVLLAALVIIIGALNVFSLGPFDEDEGSSFADPAATVERELREGTPPLEAVD